MALTISEAAKLAANNYEFHKAAVLATFAESSPLMRNMVVETVPGLSYTWTREAFTSGGVGFRGINEGFASDQGTFETLSVVLKEAGGDMDIDIKLLRNAANGDEIRARHQALKSKTLGQLCASKLILGDSGADAREFDGLKIKTGGASPTAGGQVIDNGGGALSLKKLDELMDSVDNNVGMKYLVMSKAMRRNLTAFLRNSVSISTGRDEFGSQIISYNGCPILEADESGNIATIGFDEEGSTTTSIYCVAIGESGLKVVQGAGGMDVRSLGERDSQPQERIRVDWSIALVDEHPRCAARLFSMTNATATA